MENRVRERSEIETGTSPEEPPTKKNPSYGSKKYWEDRYTSGQVVGEEKGAEEDSPEALHSWYFTYDDLSPLLLPLILGSGEGEECEECEDYDIDDDIDDQEPSTLETQDESSDGNVSANARTEESKGLSSRRDDQDAPLDEGKSNIDDSNGNSGGEDNRKEHEMGRTDDDNEDGICSQSREGKFEDLVEIVEDEEEESDDDDDNEQPRHREGLSKSGSIAVLEVGCGDVPLGRDLAKSIESFESQTGVAPSTIIKQVVCVDYAPSCIATLKKGQQSNRGNEIKICYEVGDARKLSYKNASFELILEKGTMDAMLSDTDEGVNNCKLIVAEAARLLRTGGFFVIVSHLNAHVQSGLQWLDRIVVPGLRMNCKHTQWEIEVHGNSCVVEFGESEEEESPGPAVYIIHKMELNEEATNSNSLTIPLKFFSY
ncbi:unnamed protein product [Cylindrotheca closterium]|uniref:Methyltransferase domain-containing protein n=1 Tax=Cylindrotheca closterium TaxID=2856 RepID=A0AAD2GCS5_9STRA|nr:unnamed protein product [Cylindrotheca closterium]